MRQKTYSQRIVTMPNYPDFVKVVEVGPRDGLQNESKTLTADERILLIEQLMQSGIQCIESGSFVSPKWVPQMAGTDKVMQSLNQQTTHEFTVLTPNLQGYRLAKDSGAKSIAVFIAASESFSQKNTNCTIEEALQNAQQIITQAKQDNIKVRGYLSCVIDCPYEGKVSLTKVVELATRLERFGVFEISLGDTIGTGTPQSVHRLLSAVGKEIPMQKIAVHFHDTYGQALANTLMALQMGIAIVDSAVGGLGGCPYAQGASGNLATEDLVYMLNGLGVSTGIDLQKLCAVSRWLQRSFAFEVRSKVSQTHILSLSH